MGDPMPDPTPDELRRLRLGLRMLALQRLGDPAAAEEAAQETLVRVLEALRRGRLRRPDRLAAFARGVLRHVVTDRFRAGSRRVPLNGAGAYLTSPARHDALAGLVSAEERRRLRAALARLSERDRQVLRLCYYDGLTPAEVAAHLGEPAPRIRKRKSRALDRLRHAFHRTRPGHGLHARPTPGGGEAGRERGTVEERWSTTPGVAPSSAPGSWRSVS